MAKGDWEGPHPSEPKDRPIPTEGTKRKTWAEEAFIGPFDVPQRGRERDGVPAGEPPVRWERGTVRSCSGERVLVNVAVVSPGLAVASCAQKCTQCCSGTGRPTSRHAFQRAANGGSLVWPGQFSSFT